MLKRSSPLQQMSVMLLIIVFIPISRFLQPPQILPCRQRRPDAKQTVAQCHKQVAFPHMVSRSAHTIQGVVHTPEGQFFIGVEQLVILQNLPIQPKVNPSIRRRVIIQRCKNVFSYHYGRECRYIVEKLLLVSADVQFVTTHRQRGIDSSQISDTVVDGFFIAKGLHIVGNDADVSVSVDDFHFLL